MSVWDPAQYDRFQAERRQPFFDLLDLVEVHRDMRVADLGCGTGELTRILHRRLGACETLGIDFQEGMLSWEPGKRDTDGVWAKYWYKNVEDSTTFQPYKPKPDEVPAHLDAVYKKCLKYYQLLYEHRLTV